MSVRNRTYYGFKYPTSLEALNVCSQKDIINFIIKNVQKLDFTQKDDSWLREWNVFDNINWKKNIRFSLTDSKLCKNIKYGKLFKSSPNGIYDYTTGIVPLGAALYAKNSHIVVSEHGIIVLNINSLQIYCYYWVDMGGCPTCGMDSGDNGPYEIKLYMCESINGLVTYCISKFERIDLFCRYYDEMIKTLPPPREQTNPIELLNHLI